MQSSSPSRLTAIETSGSLLNPLLHAALAAALIWFCWQDLPAAQARLALASLPDHDFLAQAETLRLQQKFSEAELVARAGQDYADEPARRAELEQALARIDRDRSAWRYRLSEVGGGALTGRGESLEALGGAIAADLLVFGDVRDLVIQSGNAISGAPVDEVLVVLSTAGLLLTVAPGADFGAALLKFARRAGAMSKRLAAAVLRASRRAVSGKGTDELVDLARNSGRLGRAAGAAPAVRIFKQIDSPADLARAAKFAERGSAQTYALWAGGASTLDALRSGAKAQTRLLVKVGRKGPQGFKLAARSGRLMLKPHPLLGLIKGIYKGNVPQALVELMQRAGVPLLGLAGAWLGFALALLGWRARRLFRARLHASVAQGVAR